ncbi:MAG: hypothetical protein AAF609_12980 [Cyanobacteria bacterium P01_C01_bin.120]
MYSKLQLGLVISSFYNPYTAALLNLPDWMAVAQSRFSNAVATISRRFGEILQYFKHKTTKGVVKASIIA